MHAIGIVAVFNIIYDPSSAHCSNRLFQSTIGSYILKRICSMKYFGICVVCIDTGLSSKQWPSYCKINSSNNSLGIIKDGILQQLILLAGLYNQKHTQSYKCIA